MQAVDGSPDTLVAGVAGRLSKSLIQAAKSLKSVHPQWSERRSGVKASPARARLRGEIATFRRENLNPMLALEGVRQRTKPQASLAVREGRDALPRILQRIFLGQPAGGAQLGDRGAADGGGLAVDEPQAQVAAIAFDAVDRPPGHPP